MGGKAARRKGCEFEREVVKLLQAAGLAAERIPLSGAFGGSFCGVPVLNQDRRLECKRRARAFGTLYGFLNGSYAVVIRDDRCEPMVVMKLEDWARLALGQAMTNTAIQTKAARNDPERPELRGVA